MTGERRLVFWSASEGITLGPAAVLLAPVHALQVGFTLTQQPPHQALLSYTGLAVPTGREFAGHTLEYLGPC